MKFVYRINSKSNLLYKIREIARNRKISLITNPLHLGVNLILAKVTMHTIFKQIILGQNAILESNTQILL